MARHPRHMRISELSEHAETPLSTIKHYLREGLLPAPIRTGKTMSYYTEDHLLKLIKIKELKQSGLPLASIRNVFGIDATSPRSRIPSETIATSKRESIVSAAVGLFREKGYGATRISDIAGRAGISKATFYQYFGKKEDVFLESVDTIFYDIGSGIPEIREERDAVRKIKLRALHFVKSHSHMIDMFNQLRGASVTGSPEILAKLEEATENLIGPIRNDLEMALRQYKTQPFDCTLMAHLLLGAVEYFLYYQEDKKDDPGVLLGKILTSIFGGDVPYRPRKQQEEQ